MTNTSLDQLCVDTIRTLCIDGVQQANSGHPGMPMGMADVAYVLWTQFLRHNPKNPQWFNRDRFILSAGHGSMLLYSLLHLTGYDLSLNELKRFRQWDSKTPGHPEFGLTPGVEMTTGPLGQGFASGVGMAIAEAFLAATFNRDGYQIIDHYTYAIVSDGDLMEGVSHEAASMAGHMGLGKLIYLYDDNQISIDGSTNLAFTENRMQRFEAYGWHTQQIDGHDRVAIAEAIEAAQAVTTKPSIIACRTHIGFGSPNKQDSASSHGSPLGPNEVRLTKQAYGWDSDRQFHVPNEALALFQQAIERGADQETAWQKRLAVYASDFPDVAKRLQQAISGELPQGWENALPLFPADTKGMATRSASGQTLNSLASVIPNLIGGSADLAPSNNTYLKGYPVFANDTFAGRNLHFGVREHAMVAALNGMTLHGGVISYGGTFLVFADYCRPAIRLAALSHLPIILVFTHDSIGLGEDGPTHQPVEHLASLRAIPNLTVIRPADANETAEAWRFALKHKTGPIALILTRQPLPVLDPSATTVANNLAKGAYILRDSGKEQPEIILMASGSELHLALEAHIQLTSKGVASRLISVPSLDLFEQQPIDYQEMILPRTVKARVAIEAGVAQGWHAHVGTDGAIISMNRFGASAPYQTLYEKFGFTVDNITRIAEMVTERQKAPPPV